MAIPYMIIIARYPAVSQLFFLHLPEDI